MHFGPPLDWLIKDVKMDNALVERLESWTMQFVYFRYRAYCTFTVPT